MKLKLVATCLFGFESTVKYELLGLGIKPTDTRDGRVYFQADEEEIILANLCLRTAERVHIVAGSFHAKTFEQYYQGIRHIAWHYFLEPGDAFSIEKVNTIKSELFSKRDLQRVTKKAMIDRLLAEYACEKWEEERINYPIHVFGMKDEFELRIDTSGESLHKRGYRVHSGEAPLRETIAAYMVMKTPWRGDRPFVDPLCGSATIAIEAALLSCNIQPGINRTFRAEEFSFIGSKRWEQVKKRLKAEEKKPALEIYASDQNSDILTIARENARKAGVGHQIHFQDIPLNSLSFNQSHGIVVTNPPYGERIADEKELFVLYEDMKVFFSTISQWGIYVLTTEEHLHTKIQVDFQKKSKIYNGTLPCWFYQKLGPRPPHLTSQS